MSYVSVAVPLPLPEPLLYSVPAPFESLVAIGSRARVRVGKQRVIGVIVDQPSEAPANIRVRDLDEVVDREPVVTPDLMQLARFAANYYLAPLGEVLRSILPSHLPPWGARKVWLTDAGALAPARSTQESQVIEYLRSHGRVKVAELQRATGLPDLAALLDRLAEEGRAVVGERQRRGARYTNAVELPPGALLKETLEKVGRSAKGRAVIEYLAALGRPDSVEGVATAVGCTPTVVRRLVKLHLLRTFTQIEQIDLGRHRLSSSSQPPKIVPRPDQQTAIDAIEQALDQAREKEGPAAGFLLAGMTGSGKTEVYLRAASHALALGRSSILLVPEIALVPALAQQARHRFGDRLAILHSALSANERHQEWERLRQGSARVVLGPRSALFAPIQDLGLLVVDEEQDSSYKQDITPHYNGRDLALVRGRDSRAVTVLVSATPSLESRLNVQRGRLTRLELTQRAGQGSLPEGILVDLRKEPKASRKPGDITFSERLHHEVTRALEAKDQVILLRNRRGYSPILLCRACGEDQKCDACGLPRTFHRRQSCLICHYCGSTRPVPQTCHACGESALEPIGAGTERVEEQVRDLFPQAKVAVLDRDTVRRPGGAAAVLESFGQEKIDILVGTQMVSKGHHFPKVALTAVLAADTYLGFPDFRAVEKTYNLLTQLAGRAGRGQRPGRVVIQTYHPDHYAIQAALNHDDQAFARQEMRFRQAFHYPPYSRMVQILIQDPKRDRAEGRMRQLAQDLLKHPLSQSLRITGPAPAPLEKLRNRWRFQLLLRGTSGKKLHQLIKAVVPKKPSYDLTIDVDPYHLL